MKTTLIPIKTVVLAAICAAFMISCGNNEIEISNPTSYSFAREGVSTVSFSGQTTRISMAKELIDGLKDMDNLDESTLLEMYSNQTKSGDDTSPYTDEALNASTKSVKSKVAASADFFSSNTTESAAIKADLESWIIAQVNEVGPNSNKLAEAGIAGQIADGSSARYVNAKGLEYDQAFTKSLIGALMVDQICNNYLSTTVLDAGTNIADNDSGFAMEGKSYTNMEHKWDEAYGYLFGATSDTENPLATLGADAFLSKYLERVDADLDFAGIASEIYEAFKLGRAAIVAGDYETRDKQAAIIKEAISEVIAIRAIYYLQAGKNALAAGDMGGAFHDLSEGYGFVYSLRFTRLSDRNESYFSKAEVDGFMSQLTAGNGFWDIQSSTLDQISEDIANEFSFTIAQAAE